MCSFKAYFNMSIGNFIMRQISKKFVLKTVGAIILEMDFLKCYEGNILGAF